ncbi:MAG: imidazolonepropionase [Actinobacteria bacterium]|nr:imidazolonepropionase [Actinomycetota bacterium]MCA1720638.1 imidazolonepropionase [Actinomycetota bacterium]
MSLLVRGGPILTWDEGPVSALVIDGGRVVSHQEEPADEVLELDGRCALPGFVDAHTHLVFGGDRAEEFEARLGGTPYAAGGIRTTVAATRAASTDELTARAVRLAAEALRSGTTTLEVKSGYGLTVEDELRCLQAAAAVTEHRTFLGAHVVPDGTDSDAYVDLVRGPMLDAVLPVATGIDAFCEEGAFDADQCREILSAGAAAGLDVHVHANQLGHSGGIELAASLRAASADHCTFVRRSDVTALRDAGVVAVLVPAAEFSTGSSYAPARRLLEAGVTVALATDCNPGTSFTTSMPFVIALACRELGMTPLEAIRAATLGGAAALRSREIGHLRVGARADLVVLDAPSPTWLAYRPGVDLVRSVVRGGEVVR